MNKFINVIKFILIGAFTGLLAGLAFGLLIWLITMLLSTQADTIPREAAGFLGMGFGTVLGAIFGGIIGLKEK